MEYELLKQFVLQRIKCLHVWTWKASKRIETQTRIFNYNRPFYLMTKKIVRQDFSTVSRLVAATPKVSIC